MEGWVDPGKWLHNEMVYPPTNGHPPSTNSAAHDRESDSRPVDHNSDALTATSPSYIHKPKLNSSKQHPVVQLVNCTVVTQPSSPNLSPHALQFYPTSRSATGWKPGPIFKVILHFGDCSWLRRRRQRTGNRGGRLARSRDQSTFSTDD